MSSTFSSTSHTNPLVAQFYDEAYQEESMTRGALVTENASTQTLNTAPFSLSLSSDFEFELDFSFTTESDEDSAQSASQQENQEAPSVEKDDDNVNTPSTQSTVQILSPTKGLFEQSPHSLTTTKATTTPTFGRKSLPKPTPLHPFKSSFIEPVLSPIASENLDSSTDLNTTNENLNAEAEMDKSMVGFLSPKKKDSTTGVFASVLTSEVRCIVDSIPYLDDLYLPSEQDPASPAFLVSPGSTESPVIIELGEAEDLEAFDFVSTLEGVEDEHEHEHEHEHKHEPEHACPLASFEMNSDAALGLDDIVTQVVSFLQNRSPPVVIVSSITVETNTNVSAVADADVKDEITSNDDVMLKAETNAVDDNFPSFTVPSPAPDTFNFDAFMFHHHTDDARSISLTRTRSHRDSSSPSQSFSPVLVTPSATASSATSSVASFEAFNVDDNTFFHSFSNLSSRGNNNEVASALLSDSDPKRDCGGGDFPLVPIDDISDFFISHLPTSSGFSKSSRALGEEKQQKSSSLVSIYEFISQSIPDHELDVDIEAKTFVGSQLAFEFEAERDLKYPASRPLTRSVPVIGDFTADFTPVYTLLTDFHQPIGTTVATVGTQQAPLSLPVNSLGKWNSLDAFETASPLDDINHIPAQTNASISIPPFDFYHDKDMYEEITDYARIPFYISKVRSASHLSKELSAHLQAMFSDSRYAIQSHDTCEIKDESFLATLQRRESAQDVVGAMSLARSHDVTLLFDFSSPSPLDDLYSSSTSQDTDNNDVKKEAELEVSATSSTFVASFYALNDIVVSEDGKDLVSLETSMDIASRFFDLSGSFESNNEFSVSTGASTGVSTDVSTQNDLISFHDFDSTKKQSRHMETSSFVADISDMFSRGEHSFGLSNSPPRSMEQDPKDEFLFEISCHGESSGSNTIECHDADLSVMFALGSSITNLNMSQLCTPVPPIAISKIPTLADFEYFE